MERPRILSGAIAALRESSLTAWFVAAASGPAMSYASWEFLGYRGLLPGAIAALSITFAARIVTDRHLAPTAPPTRRCIATATAAALPVIATAVGGIVLAPFATYGTAYHLSCLPYIIYGCDASPPPAVVVATLVALAVLIFLVPLPACLLMKGASRQRLHETVRASIQNLCCLRVLGVLILASAVLTIPVWILATTLGEDSILVADLNAATDSLLALVLACSAIAVARTKGDPPGRRSAATSP